MKQLLLLALISLVAVFACTGPDIPKQSEVRVWYVDLMRESGTISRECKSDERWQAWEPDEEDLPVFLKAFETTERLGRAAAAQGVEMEEDPYGVPLMTFTEEIRDDVWRSLWPEVEAYMTSLERQFKVYRAAAAEIECS